MTRNNCYTWSTVWAPTPGDEHRCLRYEKKKKNRERDDNRGKDWSFHGLRRAIADASVHNSGHGFLFSTIYWYRCFYLYVLSLYLTQIRVHSIERGGVHRNTYSCMRAYSVQWEKVRIEEEEETSAVNVVGKQWILREWISAVVVYEIIYSSMRVYNLKTLTIEPTTSPQRPQYHQKLSLSLSMCI